MVANRVSAAAASARVLGEQREARNLASARQALVAYSMMRLDSRQRPGVLPCPDVDGDGDSGGRLPDPDIQGSNCASLSGWLPYETLRIAEPRDASGERLWYMLSPAHQPNPFASGGSRILNSAVAGGLTLRTGATDVNDIVAIVIAPGRALANQDRPSRRSVVNARTLRAQFLEEDRQLDPAANPVVYAPAGAQAAAPGNDRYLVLRRAELFQAVERRVLGEAALALNRVRAADGEFPWLAEFTAAIANQAPGAPAPNSLQAGFRGVAGNARGWLPVGPAAGEIFATGFEVDWSLEAGSVRITLPDTGALADPVLRVEANELLNSPQDAAVRVPESQAGGALRDAACTVTEPHQVQCRGSGPWERIALTSGGMPVERRFEFVMSFQARDEELAAVQYAPANAESQRRRTVSTNTDRIGTQLNTIALGVRHALFAPERPPDWAISVRKRIAGGGVGGESQATLTLGSGARGRLRVAGMRADLNRTAMEALPNWFESNDWHRLVYVALAPARVPGASVQGCHESALPCLAVYNGTVERAGIHALAIAVGPPLTGEDSAGQDRTGVETELADFLEGSNAMLDRENTAYRAPPSVWFNDNLRIVAEDGRE